MRTLILTLASIFCLLQVQAQYTIKGKLKQHGDSAVVEYALIRVFNANDSLLTGATSGSNGVFSFISQMKPHRIQITSIVVGDSTFTNLKFSKNQQLDLGTVLLNRRNFSLDEVSVTGKVDQFEHSVGKSTYNFSNDAKVKAGDAFEMLSQVPGVDIDHQNEKVSINGKSNILYLVNGIPQADDKILKTIMPKDVKGVEIVKAPSGKYNPMEYSAVLNILLKDKVPQGFQLTTQVGVESMLRGNSGRVNLSYGHGSVRTFFNYRLFAGNTDQTTDTWRTNKQTGEELYQHKVYDKNQSYGNHFSYGLDYYIDSLNVLSVKAMNWIYNYTPTFHKQNQFTNTVSPLDYITEVKRDEEFTYSSYTLFYKHTFKRPGQELSFQTDYYRMGADDKKTIKETYSEQKILAYNEIVDNKKDYIKIRVDFTVPIVEGHSVNVGANFYYQNAENTTKGYRAAESMFEEKRYTGYADYTFSKGKFRTNIGARIDKPEVFIDDVDQERKPRVAPYGNINYQTENFGVTLKYSRETWFQGYWLLNPNITRVDSLTYSQGNPNLRPMIYSRVSLDINHQPSKKLNLSYSLSYNLRNHDVVHVLLPYEGNTWVRRPIEAGEVQEYSVYLSGQYKVTPKLKVSMSGSVNYGVYTSDLTSVDLSIEKQENFGLWASMNIDWQLPKGFSVSANYSYDNFPGVTYTGTTEWPNYWRVDIAKKLTKHAKLNLYAYNLFSTNESRIYEESDLYKNTKFDRYDFEGLVLRFTYDFSTGKRFRPVRTKRVEKD